MDNISTIKEEQLKVYKEKELEENLKRLIPIYQC